MKIGILTFHRAINYGAVLQCFSLYTTLKSLGYDVEIIDYRPEAIEKYRMYFRMRDFSNERGMKGRLRYLASSIALIGSKKRTSTKFDDFLSKNFQMSSIVNSNTDVPSYYDAVFFGSDQIWSPEICEGLDKMYYGQFEKGKAKFFGYAASLGRQDLIVGETEQVFRSYISVYDRIAVRENSLKGFLLENFKLDADIVCDPSLLMSKADCETIAVKPKDEKYVLVFNLDANPNAIPFAQRIASQIGAKVIMMEAVSNPLRRYPCDVRPELSPAEFLGYILHAECVVTNSFHATSFSIIMEKNFYTLLRKKNNDRAKTILAVAGLPERQVDAKSEIEFSAIDYNGVANKLEDYKQKSLDYINACLSLV